MGGAGLTLGDWLVGRGATLLGVELEGEDFFFRFFFLSFSPLALTATMSSSSSSDREHEDFFTTKTNTFDICTYIKSTINFGKIVGKTHR